MATTHPQSVSWSCLSVVILTFALVLGGAPPAEAANPSTQTVINRILAETNKARTAEGKSTLVINTQMNTVAQKWSQKMASANTLSHNSSFSAQIPSGWRGAAENVAMGYSYTQVTGAWMNSPGHRTNILGTYTHIGIGVAYTSSGAPYYTQVFGRYSKTLNGDQAVSSSRPSAKAMKKGKVRITGKAQVGKRLKVKRSGFTAGAKYTYRWYAGGKAIPKATKASYKIASKYRGKRISVRVTAKKSGYSSVKVTSAKTKKVAKR